MCAHRKSRLSLYADRDLFHCVGQRGRHALHGPEWSRHVQAREHGRPDHRCAAVVASDSDPLGPNGGRVPGCDVIFVQEVHLENAIACLQSKLSRGLHGLKEAKDAENALSDRESMSLADAGEEVGALASASRVGDGQYLTVYPESLVLVRLQKDALRASAYGLTQLVLLSTGSTSSEGEGELLGQTGEMSFWCCCETAEEVSLIMDERCLTSFEEDSLIVSPDRWRAIKLSGRAYGFDETGVVAAMSGCSTDTQVLNVSCFGSNVAFVLDDMLDDAIETLCSSLDISRVER
ncbi:hypothetical protein V7S43_009677 [Phytophthora oleae]|uniref:CASTOR ACT domain-containing protein n=1 Tax=Phytophthora oleae TaxID=2107226 RepID=A0ABD3FFI4_9STRA